MPQLDSVTYFSQVFWVLLVFIFFYIFVLKQLLPLLARSLKVRLKKTDINKFSVNVYKNEILNTQKSFDILFINSWNVFSLLSVSSNISSSKWVNNNIFAFNDSSLTNFANTAFLKSVGDSKSRQLNVESKIV